MTTDSYPAKGLGGFTIGEWTKEWGGQNGVINDLTGDSLSLTRIDAGNIARIGVGQVRVGGYVLEVTANHDLTVGTSAATYWIWACYDPALNVADGSNNASATGPCTLGISTGAPSTTGGKIYVLLYQIVRAASQALTAATVRPFRVWTGPTIHMSSANGIPSELLTDPQTAVTGFSYPLGSRLIYGDGTEYTLIKSTSGLKWSGGGFNNWTPTWDTTNGGGITNVGTGGRNIGFYRNVGGMVHAEFRIELAVNFVLNTGTFAIALPVPAYISGWGGATIQSTLGSWVIRHEIGGPYHFSGSLGLWDTAGLYASFDGAWDGNQPRSRVDSNDPMEWDVGDVFSGNLNYRAA